MQNKYIFYLIVANILWSFIPVLVIDLFNEVSLIMIIFLRFFVSGIIFFVLGFGLICYNNAFTKNEKITLKELVAFITHKNKAFDNVRNVFYLAILGFFGIILQIIGYFLSLKTTSIGFTMTGYFLSIILIAFYEHGVRTERFDIFKILYLLMLVFSISIIIFVKSQESIQKITFIGTFYMLFFTISMTFLQIGIEKDTFSKDELKLIYRNKNYKIVRLLLKLSLTFLMGIGLMFPFFSIFLLFPIKTELDSEIILFFAQFSNFFQYLFRWEILFLIFFSTITTNLLMFISSQNWSPYSLTYSQWSSILNIIEPFGGLLFGVIFIGEYFPTEYLVIIFFLLFISILFRYAHESRNQVNAILLLRHRQGFLTNIPHKLLKLEGVYNVDYLIGTEDILLNIKTNSIRNLYNLINAHIRDLKEIYKITILFIQKVIKVSK